MGSFFSTVAGAFGAGVEAMGGVVASGGGVFTARGMAVGKEPFLRASRSPAIVLIL
ncbi:MAG: hypothetical protein AAB725_00240 [Patescibacteria group bacterium]